MNLHGFHELAQIIHCKTNTMTGIHKIHNVTNTNMDQNHQITSYLAPYKWPRVVV